MNTSSHAEVCNCEACKVTHIVGALIDALNAALKDLGGADVGVVQDAMIILAESTFEDFESDADRVRALEMFCETIRERVYAMCATKLDRKFQS